ncbi:MAG TPA: nitronate monooxygenase [Mycobacteriales bacterium]|nr:nitronate monooxygenase [Mycobacteriales bacterium]
MSGLDFCAALGMTLPVVQAPIGSAATPALAAAVSNAGGLGSLALSWTPVEACAARVRAATALTDRPFATNVVLAWPQEERVRACLDAGVRVVSTSWGDPAPCTALIHRAGALHVHMVASAEEARRAADAGVDAVVAQGWEAGGHVAGQVSTLALVPAVVDAVSPVPVLAAGGITDGRGVAAALVLGAAAAWVGTRFLLAAEADVHPEYRARLIAASETDTVYGGLFDGGWPDAPHRTLRNSTTRAWQEAGSPAPGARPGEGDVVARRGDAGAEIRRYSDDLPLSRDVGDVEAMALYAGQGVGLVRRTAPAAEIALELAHEARQVLAAIR